MSELRRILYEGSKSFWKLKTSVKIVIAEYSYLDVLEISVYDTLAEFEAEPVYVCAIALRAVLESRQKLVLAEDSTAGVFVVKTSVACDEEISAFIYNHMFIKTYLPVSKCMEVVVRQSYADQGDSELMIPKPADLKLVPSPFGRNEPDGAHEPTLTKQGLWRRPLIMARVLKGLPLTERDAKIWHQFAQDKTESELLECMSKTLAQHVPESEMLLKHAAHASSLPPQTPFPAPRLKAPSALTLPCELTAGYTSSPTSVAASLRVAKKSLVPEQRFESAQPKKRSLLEELFSISITTKGDEHSTGAMSGQRSPSEDMVTMYGGALVPSAPSLLVGIPSLGALRESLRRKWGVHSSRSRDDFHDLNDRAGDDRGTKAHSGYATDDDEQAGEHSGIMPSASAGICVKKHARRHTYDAVRPKLPRSASAQVGVAATARKHQHHRTGSGSLLSSFVNYMTAKESRHAENAAEVSALNSAPASLAAQRPRRSGSGGLLAGIAGPSNRILPTAWVNDGGAELDCGIAF